MALVRRAKALTVSHSGAGAGCVLRGSGLNNQGIRLQITQQQERGNDGAIKGPFVILDVGDNKHSDALASLLHQQTDAGEVLGIIRERHAGCVHVANANILVLEQPADHTATDKEKL